MQAIREDGTVVKAGDKITDFRGQEWTFLEVTRQGRRVYARKADGWAQELFPTVFDLKVRPVEDGKRVSLPPDSPSGELDFVQGTKGE